MANYSGLPPGVVNTTHTHELPSPYLSITSNVVSDSQLTTALWLNTLLGMLCFIAFCFLQRSVFPKHYRYRMVSQSVTVKPKPLPTEGPESLWAWLVQALTATDAEILRSSGLDAMVMIKALAMGVQIFLPLAVIGCGVLLPLHYMQGSSVDSHINRSQLMGLTLAALPRGSPYMWVHFVLIVVYNAWIMYVLAVKYREFSVVRMHYLTKGDDPNYWMALTQQAEAEFMARKVRKMLLDVDKTVAQSSQGRQPPPEMMAVEGDKGPSPPPSTIRDSMLSVTASRMGQWWKAVTSKALNTHASARNSVDSYKQYNSNSTTPGMTPPTLSPEASSAGTAAAVPAWGRIRMMRSSSSELQVQEQPAPTSEGWRAAGIGQLQGPPPSGSAPPQVAAGGSDAGQLAPPAAAAVGRRCSGGSSSGSDAGTSGAGAAAAGGGGGAGLPAAAAAAAAGEAAPRGGRRQGRQGSPGRARGDADGGLKPTYQTISELHSVTAQVAPFQMLPMAPGWGTMPKHMRTITEDSLEYRLAEHQAASRPSSRNGHRGSSNAGSSSDGTNYSPKVSAAAALAAAAALQGAGLSSSSSSSGSPQSGIMIAGRADVAPGVPTPSAPSPLSRSSSAQVVNGISAAAAAAAAAGTPEWSDRTPSAPGTAGGVAPAVSNGGSVAVTQRSSAYGTVSDMSTHFSLDSGGLSSVCTRITHNSSCSCPSSPASGSSMAGGSRDGLEAEDCGRSSSSSTPAEQHAEDAGDESSDRSWVTGSSRGSPDISFATAGQSAGGSGAELRLSPALEAEYFVPSAVRRSSDDPGPVSSSDVHLEGIPEDRPAVAAHPGGDAATDDGGRTQHTYQSSVDFATAGLLDFSRSPTPFSPQDGGLSSPQPAGNRSSRRKRSGCWSPFASSEIIAANIAAEGVAGSSSSVHLAGAVPGADLDSPPAADGSSGQWPSHHSSERPAAVRISTAGGAAENWLEALAGSGGGSHEPAPSAGANRSNVAAAAGAGSSSMKEAMPLPTVPAMVPDRHQLGAPSSDAAPGSGPGSGVIRSHRDRGQQVHSGPATGPCSAPLSGETSPSTGNEEQRLQHHHHGTSAWHMSWQSMMSRVTNSSSSTNGHSRLVSPPTSLNPTPREGGAVAGAAVGAGLRLPVPAAHSAMVGGAVGALNLTSMLDVDGETLQNIADAGVILNGGPVFMGEDFNGLSPCTQPQPVAFCWWKELPNNVRPSDENETHLGVDDWVNKYDNQPLLAKPSVRFRKTINVRIKKPQANEPEMKAANAQHYCVLVTDVKQWPYPELQLAANLQQKPHWARSALQWVGTAVGKMPALLSWGLKGLAEDHQHSEEQQLLSHYVQRHSTDGQDLLGAHPQVGRVLSDMHPPIVPAAAAAGGGGGGLPAALGAAPVVSGGGSAIGAPIVRALSSKGQPSSCATSVEGLGAAALPPGSAVLLGNPLARLSHMSGISYTTHLPDSLEECDSFLAMADRQVEDAKQKVMSDPRLTPEEREHKLRKVDKARQELIRWAQEQREEQERRQQLAREHSLMHLDPVSRTASFLKPGLAPYSGPAGAAACLSRSHSSKAMQLSARSDNAVAGAAVGTPEFSTALASRRPSAIGSLQQARAHPPGSIPSTRESSGALPGPGGAGGAGPPPMRDRSGALGPGPQNMERQQWQRQRVRVCDGRPTGVGWADGDTPLHRYSAPWAAAASAEAGSAGGAPAGVAPNGAPGHHPQQQLLAGHCSEPHPVLQDEQATPQPQQAQGNLQQQAQGNLHQQAQGNLHQQASRAHSMPVDTELLSAVLQPAAAAGARTNSSASVLLLGEMSLEQPISGHSSGLAAAGSMMGYPAAQSAAGPDPPQAALISLDSVSSPLAHAVPACELAPVAAPSVQAHRHYTHGQQSEGGQPRQQPVSPSSSTSAAAAAAGSTQRSLPVPAARSAVAESGTLLQPQLGSSASSQPAGGPCSPPGGAPGLSDSYDSSVSSYNASRMMVSFKPVPPRSPRSAQQFRQLDILQGPDGPGRRFPSSPVLSCPSGIRSPSRQQVRHDPFLHSEGSASRLGPVHTYGSGGGAAAVRPTALVGPGFGRSKSARYSSSGSSQTDSIHQHSLASMQAGPSSHPEHLLVMIPPLQHGPPSRTFSPLSGGSGGGAAASMMAYGGVSPQPWGLPPDAAAIKSSLIMVNQGLGSPRAAAGAQAHLAQQLKSRSRRMSISGAVGGTSHGPTNPLASQDAVQQGLQAAIVGAGVGVPLASTSSLSPSEASEAALSLADKQQQLEIYYSVAEPLQDEQQQQVRLQQRQQRRLLPADPRHHREKSLVELIMQIPRQFRGWSRVRFALYYRNYNGFHNRKSVLLRLPEMEMYSIVTSTFNRLFPKDFDRAIPVFNHKKVDLLLMEWEATVAALEKAELTKERTGREPLKLDSARCGKLLTCCPGACGCAGCHSYTICLEACCGRSHMKPIIPELLERVIKLEEDIEAARREAFQSSFTPSWFVMFKSQQAAAIAASTRIYAEDAVQFQVHPAPGPEEVNWQHLWMTWRERDCRTILVWPFTLAIVLFPITLMTSAASRLDYVFCPQLVEGLPTPAFYWDWYCTNKTVGGTLPSFLRAFITGWLPNLLLNLWLVMVLPRLVYLLVQSEGSCFSLSALERRIGAVFFYWDIFNVFLQGTIGSSFFMQVRKIIQSPEQLPSILGAALPDSSNFFMQFIAMRALFLIWLRMCVPHGGVWQNWCHYCFCLSCCCSTCNTDRDKSLTYGPRTPRYGFEMGHMLLMYLIAIAFSIVSPLLLPFSVVWFAFAWVAWRHNLSYVYQRKYESGGLMWMFLFSRIVMCLVVGQLFTFCVLVVRGAYWQAFLIIAFMPALTARYYKYCQARFARGVEYGVPLDTAQRNDANREAQVPAHVYIPPPLQNRSWGWYPEWNKMWDGWGMPAYSV